MDMDKKDSGEQRVLLPPNSSVSLRELQPLEMPLNVLTAESEEYPIGSIEPDDAPKPEHSHEELLTDISYMLEGMEERLTPDMPSREVQERMLDEDFSKRLVNDVVGTFIDGFILLEHSGEPQDQFALSCVTNILDYLAVNQSVLSSDRFALIQQRCEHFLEDARAVRNSSWMGSKKGEGKYE